MKTCKVFGIVFAVVAALAFVAAPAGAFLHPWAPYLSANVAATERAFYDDIAAGAVGYAPYEAGLLLFVNNQALDETVGYYTVHGLPVSVAFNYLEVRAAVSDYGFFRVGYSNSPTGVCIFPSQLLWAPTSVTNAPYLTKVAPLPTNYVVRKICILLSDYPDAVAVGKTNALIDHIRLRTAGGATGWMETFTGTP